MVRYKQKCMVCKKGWALITYYKQQPICKECQLKMINSPIEDPEMKKMFDIDPKFYDESSFMRSIRVNYARFGSLSERQIEFFKKAVADMKAGIKRPQKQPKKKSVRKLALERESERGTSSKIFI